MLEDGTAYRGLALGKKGTAGGEICFNTGMTGYQEIYTDPSYYGQIVVNTTPHIGNYGVQLDTEEESEYREDQRHGMQYFLRRLLAAYGGFFLAGILRAGQYRRYQ